MQVRPAPCVCCTGLHRWAWARKVNGVLYLCFACATTMLHVPVLRTAFCTRRCHWGAVLICSLSASTACCATCRLPRATCRRGGSVRLPRHVFSGRSAKELSVAVLEPQGADTPQPLPWCSRLEHANYLVGVGFFLGYFIILFCYIIRLITPTTPTTWWACGGREAWS